uniref:Uncharacterized protein n=1 Tax=Moschus moschiferus TaxID=68415 RepID=A0A8C6D414_MOSMO
MELLRVLKRGLQQVSGHGGLRGYLRVLFRANAKGDSGVGPTFNILQVKTKKSNLHVKYGAFPIIVLLTVNLIKVI